MLKRNRLVDRIKALFPRIPPPAPDPSAQIPAKTPVAGALPKERAQRVRVGYSYRREMVTALKESPPPLSDNSYTAPLTIAGVPVGAIQTAAEDAPWTSRDIEIIDGVAALLAQHLENLSRPEPNEQARG